jgi:rhodanese-related sulfurtransferase
VSVREVAALTETNKELQFIDVRRAGEYADGHAVRAHNIPLDKLPNDFEKLDPEKPTYVICQGGYRSSAGASLLERAGFSKLYNVTGGTAAWLKEGLETEKEAAACAI